MQEENVMNRVLVVDEDMAIRLLYSDELGEEGYDVVTGELDSELIDLIAKKRPDVVVLDVPGNDPGGLGLCRHIRKTYDDLPVILSSVYATDWPGTEPAVADACGTLSSDLGELKMAIQRAVESRGRGLTEFPFKEDDRHGAPLEENR
jgi:DNA-binding NtrC family response regulator